MIGGLEARSKQWNEKEQSHDAKGRNAKQPGNSIPQLIRQKGAYCGHEIKEAERVLRCIRTIAFPTGRIGPAQNGVNKTSRKHLMSKNMWTSCVSVNIYTKPSFWMGSKI